MTDTDLLPTDPRTGKPLPPRAQPGYYPGFSTLSQKAFWDEATRAVVVDRVEHPPELRFFTPEEAPLMRAVCARILPQEDRANAHQIPIINGIDKRLFEKRTDGYRYEAMPKDWDAYRLGLQAIDAIAQQMHGKDFIACGAHEQDETLQTLHDGKPPAGQEIWDKMPVHRFWALLVQDVAEQYYAHPWAWDEIGFGGPSYPRAYFRLEHGQPEPWEVQEKRYEWNAPPSAVSGELVQVAGANDGATPGQGGTH